MADSIESAERETLCHCLNRTDATIAKVIEWIVADEAAKPLLSAEAMQHIHQVLEQDRRRRLDQLAER